MLLYVFAAVGKDRLDVMAPGVGGGNCNKGGIVQQGEHSHVVVGFKNNAQMHIYRA